MTAIKNAFIDEVNSRGMCQTENGALQHLTTGSALVDQFGKAGNYRGRNLGDVFEEQAKIWNENAELAIRFPFYLRMVTRKVKINKENVTDKSQSGQGARDESFKRLLWVAKNHPNDFYNNIFILPLVGSWKDIWTIMFYDKKFNVNAIEKNILFDVLSNGLQSETHVDLVKKFMPRIKSSSKCTTDWTKETNALAKDFSKFLGISYKEYNKLKASGKAHDFQKIICARKYDELEWKKIPGRALHLLVNGKFLSNHNLTDSYTSWIIEQPTAKFTGYVFELSKRLREKGLVGGGYNKVTLPIEVKHTLDAQFDQLVKTALEGGKITENVLCCLDTSGSMGSRVSGLKNVSCCDIATSLALFFAKINKGAFHNVIMRFDNTCYPVTLTSESFCECTEQLPHCGCGGTNFQGVIDEIVKIRKEKPQISLKDYPTTIVAVSDMQFNSCGWGGAKTTNYDIAKDKLLDVFPKEFVDKIRFIWWDVSSRYGTNGFESKSTDDGSMFISGFDGSIMTLLLGEENVVDEKSGETRRPTAEDLVKKALSQEILNYVQLADKK